MKVPYILTYFCVIITALFVSNSIVPYFMNFIEKHFDKKYEKDIIIILSISISLPISMFIIEPYLVSLFLK